MSRAVVTVQHLTKRFGMETVLNDVTLTLTEGHIHGIIGRNGSGKTVLMKCICGFLRPTKGVVTVFGPRHGAENRAFQSAYRCAAQNRNPSQ